MTEAATGAATAGDLPEVAGVTHRFLELTTGDGPLRVHLAEAGEGEPLLLLHGWPQHWYSWRRLVPLLADRYRLLMPDLRGFGWSDAPGRGYDSPTFAADAVALLDELGLERVRMIGHDWGGFTSFILGVEHPQRFERILALAAPPIWMRPSLAILASAWRTWYVTLNAVAGRAVLARRRYIPWFLRLGGRRELFSDGEAEIFAERLRRPEQGRASALLYRHYLAIAWHVFVRRRYEGRRLTVPTRLLFGDEDFYVPISYLKGGERHGDDLEIEIVAGCGHFIPEERPELVAERALEFFGAGRIAPS